IGYFARYRRYAQILILEIPQCIPVVKIFACLDLEQTISFVDGNQLPERTPQLLIERFCIIHANRFTL
ncbi:MAG: hypothetical protein WAL98_15835, partial [Desulfatiglandaceae bacterium]